MKIYKNNISYYKQDKKNKSADTFHFYIKPQCEDSIEFSNSKLKKNAHENISFKGLFSLLKSVNEPVFTKDEATKKIKSSFGVDEAGADKILRPIKPKKYSKDKFSQDLVKKTIWMGKVLRRQNKTDLELLLPAVMNLCFINNKFDESIYDDVTAFFKRGQSMHEISNLINAATNSETNQYSHEPAQIALELLNNKNLKNVALTIVTNSIDENGLVSEKALKANQDFYDKYSSKGLFLMHVIRKDKPKNGLDFDALETVKTLLNEKGVSIDKAYTIMNEFKGHFTKEALESLTKNIPDGMFRRVIGDYIHERLKTTLNPDKTLNKELYDLYNRCEVTPTSNYVSLCLFCYDKKKSKKVLNHTYNFVVKLLDFGVKPETIYKSLCLQKEDCINPILNILKDRKGEEIDKIINILNCTDSDIYISTKYKNFEKIYPVLKNILDIELIASLTSISPDNQKKIYKCPSFITKDVLDMKDKLNITALINMKDLIDFGVDKEFFIHNDSIVNSDYCEFVKKCYSHGINNQGLINSIYELSNDSDFELDEIFKIYKAALNSPQLREIGGEEVTESEIQLIFFDNVKETMNAYKLLGEKSFCNLFKYKIDNFAHYIQELGYNIGFKDEILVQAINPLESKLYKFNERAIKNFKQDFKNGRLSDDERKEVIKHINSLTKENNDMRKEALKDPDDCLKLALVWTVLSDEQQESIIPFIKQRSETEKYNFKNELNIIIKEFLGINYLDEKVYKKFDFMNSKYLSNIFDADDETKDELYKIAKLLDNFPNKSNLEIFNSLFQNIQTKKQFEKLKINYDKYVEKRPITTVNLDVVSDIEKQKQSAIRNLEKDFNDDLFKKIPEIERQNLYNALKKQGINIVKLQKADYDSAGVLIGAKEYLNLYKNGKPIQFDDMKPIIDILKNEFQTNSFWKENQKDSEVENARATLKNHILKLRYNEVKNAMDKKSDKTMHLAVQKADMNDISHSLFLGNHASCCTAIGTGCNQESAPLYIKNKMISCIEIKDGEQFVGNTMCFIAKVDGQPAFVMDNIELSPKYQYNDKIRDGIIQCAKNITKDIGRPDLPIYAGPNRHKVNLDGFDLKTHTLQPVGSTGEDSIYFDFDTCFYKIDGSQEFFTEMYKLA